MGIEAVLVGKIVTAVIGVLVSRAELGSEDGLPARLAGIFGSVAGDSAKARVERYFDTDGRRAAVTASLSSALAEVESAFPEIVRRGGFDVGFLEFEAADELARALVVGERPDDFAIAEAWADSWISGGRAEASADVRKARARFVNEALEPAERLVNGYVVALQARTELAELMDRQNVSLSADRLGSLEKASGRAPATPAAEYRYLQRVADQHRWLSTAGMAHRGQPVAIRLDEVFVSLSAVEDLDPTDDQDRFHAKAVADLEERRSAGELDAVAYEVELDHLNDTLGRSAPTATAEVVPALAVADRLAWWPTSCHSCRRMCSSSIS